MEELQRLDNELALVKDQPTTRIVTGTKYDEEVGYIVGYELTDMDNKTYPITPGEREHILMILNDPNVKVIDLGKTILATHQVKNIKQYKTLFGPREGGNE